LWGTLRARGSGFAFDRTAGDGQALVRLEPVPWLVIEGSYTVRAYRSPARKDSSGKWFYGPYDAQELLKKHEQELGIKMVPFRQMLYMAEMDTYFLEDEVPKGAKTLGISGTEQRRRL